MAISLVFKVLWLIESFLVALRTFQICYWTLL